jgi:DMSO/TMAO reductase YedYZ molybdopterin-dependent catalytic subunit
MKTLEQKIVSKRGILNRKIISFWIFNACMLAFLFGWTWLYRQPFDGLMGGGIRQPLRTVLNTNEAIFSKIYSQNHLSKNYPISKAVKNVRFNGDLGLDLKNKFDTAGWRLNVIKNNGDTLKLTLDDIKKLPKTEVCFNFKCIEGWDQVTWWAGVKMSDFIKAYGLQEEASMNYVGLSTPDEEYYVGIDMASALHPQTILCYELNGRPLPVKEGFPLRLIIPVKYGIKHLKLIGSMYFDNNRPKDYWFERGYDYYAGL